MYILTREKWKEQSDQVQSAMEHAIAEKRNAGSSLLVWDRDGEIGYREAGYADRETGRRIRRDDIFRCYSMTKPVTSCAVMMLVEEGRLDLYAPVSRYIPSFRNPRIAAEGGSVPAGREAMVLDLMNMTSGLAYDGTDTVVHRAMAALFEEATARMHSEHPMTTQEFASRVGECPVLFTPGSQWNYSVCADVLGAIVEIVSGMRFAQFVSERILQPLGMQDSGFSVPDAKKGRLVTAYERREFPDGHAEAVPYTGNHLAISNTGDENAFHSGGAGLFSTIDDFNRFARMLMRMGTDETGKRLLREGTVRFMTGHAHCRVAGWDGHEGYAYGNLFHVMVDPEAACTPANRGEYGWDGWLGTYFMNDPQTGLTLLLMQNRKDGGNDLVHILRNILLL